MNESQRKQRQAEGDEGDRNEEGLRSGIADGYVDTLVVLNCLILSARDALVVGYNFIGRALDDAVVVSVCGIARYTSATLSLAVVFSVRSL